MVDVKKAIVMIIIAIYITIFTKTVYATDLSLSIEGESKIKMGEPYSSSIHIKSSDLEILSVSGIIKVDGIEPNNLKVEGINGWKMTYNQDTGNFIIYNEMGSKDATIANITFVVDSNENKNISIQITKTNITTIDYEETQLDNQVKIITLEGKNTKRDAGTKKILPIVATVVVILAIIIIKKKKRSKI